MSADHGSPPLLPEPKTPMWLTVLGAALFLSAGLWWLASQPPRPSAAQQTDGGAAPSDAGPAPSPAH